ncbi:MAG: hypothetical protein ACTSVE_14995 [Candidatus Helarchaeota archaeon]
MALKWKTRALIFILIGIAAIGAALVNQAAIEIEVPGLDTNVKEAYFFQGNYYMTFKYDNGTLGSQSTLRVSGMFENATHTNVTIWEKTTMIGSFYVNPNGTVYQNGACQGNYSIWWIYVPNPMLSMGQGLKVGTTYNIIDPTGFLGIIGQGYTLVIDQKRVYWPVDLELSMILGAQASYIADIYNKSNNAKIASSMQDLTCGVMFLWNGAQHDEISLTLTDTNFPISRNRLNMFPWLFIIGTIVIVSAYLLMRKQWNNEYLSHLNVEPEDRNEITLLLIAGVGAVAIEFVDIWFYLPLGLAGNLLLHVGYLAGLGLICFKEKYGLKWLVPGILEVLFVFAITFATGEPYVPVLTAFMGSFISWLCLIYASGYEKSTEEDDILIGKIISQFI